jgi:hypothetical protein
MAWYWAIMGDTDESVASVATGPAGAELAEGSGRAWADMAVNLADPARRLIHDAAVSHDICPDHSNAAASAAPGNLA